MVRLASYLSVIFAIFARTHPRSGFGKILLWIPKLFASALSPVLALSGVIGFFSGLGKRKPAVAFSGLLGAFLNTQHVLKVTRESSSLALAFGGDWEKRVPEAIRPHLLASRWSLPTRPAPQVHCHRDLIFGSHTPTGEPLLADLWLPPEDRQPTGLGIIYLHGSGWHYGDKDLGTRPFFRQLTAQGHTILDVAYTLAPNARLKEMLADVANAILWMKTDAAQHSRVQPDRIVLMGGSAGGHLALLAAYGQNEFALRPMESVSDISVCGVVSYYGITDLLDLHHYLEGLYDPGLNLATDQWLVRYLESLPTELIVHPKNLLPNLLGTTYAQSPQTYRAASPLFQVGQHCPPTLQIHGAHDIAGVQKGMLRLHQALVAAEVPSVYIEIPDCDHGFDLILPQISPSAQAATYYTERFLALLLASDQ